MATDPLAVIESSAQAVAVLDPLRNQILAELVNPGSASSVAKALGTTRQKINYHLGILEEVGLVELVEELPRRGLTERVMVASARSYVVSPDVLGSVAANPDVLTATASPSSAPTEGDGPDSRLSARYLLAVAARIIREVAAFSGATAAVPPTLTIDTEVRFASAQDRADFTADLANAVGNLAARYHNESAPSGRWHRLVVAAYPVTRGT